MELPAQLRSLLASAERALAPDRLPLEAALFPCKAAGACGCGARQRRPSVPVRDSAMQTCPLFEVAGSLPHIDSDDDDDVAAPPVEAAAPPLQPPAHEDRSTSTDEECCPLVATPRSITEVPDRLLMAGITLPGTHDVKGRPLIMIDSQSVARASLDRHQVATLLLYYASIPTEERLSGGVCVLVASCGGGEAPSLELVDQALSLLAAAGGPAVGCALLWRPAGRKARPGQAQAQPAPAALAASGVQVRPALLPSHLATLPHAALQY
ncbi:uncharacterized protein KIAA1755 homolog [Schistocerca americana]|uniref:uncharacterized protein KIAA1755 homolog n=1 Tax=Schistocerca americana TaxID=7009 RepID=UPI001F503AC3|nr:uncharacterized protein KIAA1755 homolog [Schistocerca americana]